MMAALAMIVVITAAAVLVFDSDVSEDDSALEDLVPTGINMTGLPDWLEADAAVCSIHASEPVM